MRVVFVVDDEKPGQGRLAELTFQRLGIDDKTVQMMFDMFNEIDLDGSGEIDLEEFYRALPYVKRSPFSDRVFSIMDEDGSGEIDFREFVVAVWNYCTFELKALVKFAFGLFDLDGSGFLEQDELEELIKEVYGDTYDSNVRVQRIVDKLYENKDGQISFMEFQNFNQKYPALLYPAFEMQQLLRRRIYGAAFWEKLTKARYAHRGRNSNIFEILNDLTRDKFKAQMDDLTGGPTALPRVGDASAKEETKADAPASRRHTAKF